MVNSATFPSMRATCAARAASRAVSDLPVVAVDLNGLPEGQGCGDLPPRHGTVGALGSGIAVLCAHLTRAAVREDPPELLVVPELHDQGLFDLGAVPELIELGRAAVAAAVASISD